MDRARTSRRSSALLCVSMLAAACGGGPEARPAGGPAAALRGYEPAGASALAARGWRTDLSRRRVALDSILDGGLPRSTFVPICGGYGGGGGGRGGDDRLARAGDLALDPSEPVVVLRAEGGVRAWPLAFLLRRELVLDEVDGVPIAVSFCSLCSSAVVLDRRLGGRVLELAVSGLLHEGNSLLYDRQSESLWKQISGECVLGRFAGERLASLPSFVVSFGELARSAPGALVLRDPTAEGADHDLALIEAADVERGVPPDWLRLAGERPLELVLRLDGQPLLPNSTGARVRNLDSAGTAVVVLPDPATAGAHRGAQAGVGRPLGSQAAFARAVDGRVLSFADHPRGARDEQTGTVWNRLGQAIDGPLKGKHLAVVAQVQAFRFALGAAGRR